MEYIYVDPALLAIPNCAVDQETARELLDRVGQFANAVLTKDFVEIVAPANIEWLLYEGHCPPEHFHVEAFLDLMDISHVFSTHDLVLQYQVIIQRSTRSAEVCPVEADEIEDFTTVPILPAIDYAEYLKSETQRVFATVASIRAEAESWNVGSAFPYRGVDIYDVCVCVKRASGNKRDVIGPFPATVSSKVPAISSFSQFITEQAADRIWQNADDEVHLHASINIGAMAIAKQAGISVDGLRKFSIGSSFTDSLNIWESSKHGRFSLATRNLCSQLVAGLCQRKVKNFGVRSFDKAGGYRVQLTKAGLALRLMFWETATEIEFANVGPKHQLLIEDGLENRAVVGNSAHLVM